MKTPQEKVIENFKKDHKKHLNEISLLQNRVKDLEAIIKEMKNTILKLDQDNEN